MTIREATSEWINRSFDAIDTCILRKLYSYDPDDWHEVTEPSVGETVYVYSESCTGEIVGYDEENGFEIELYDSGKTIFAEKDDFEREDDTFWPMWNTMWGFSDSADIWWMENGGIEALSKCGFRVYESEEFGFYFGIDGCGYNFKEAHFIPLYKERGLRWHDEPEEEIA